MSYKETNKGSKSNLLVEIARYVTNLNTITSLPQLKQLWTQTKRIPAESLQQGQSWQTLHWAQAV
jgi:hypothetical protein